MKTVKIFVVIALFVSFVFWTCATQDESGKDANSSSTRMPYQAVQSLETQSFDFDTIGTIDSNKLFSKQTYVVTYYRELRYNNSVGNEWRIGVSYNDEYIASSSKIVVDSSLTEIELVAFATELDKWNDYGTTQVTFDALDIGQWQTMWATVVVIENEGRYQGNRAEWYFEITIERIT